MSTLTGIPIKPLKPGTPEWLKSISASKVPAILRVSPFQSRFTLWQTMTGNIPQWEGNKTTERGTFLEAAVIGWFKEQHKGELDVDKGRSYAHSDHPEWTAAPDAIAADLSTDDLAWNIGVEAKTAQYSDGWGQAGTAEIPPYYLAQAVWQMIVTGFRKVYVPVLFGQPFEFREYVITWEDVEADVPAIIAEVIAFQVSLADNNPPMTDGDLSTYETVRALHPDIDGTETALPDNLAYRYLINKQAAADAAALEQHAKTDIANYMGNAKKATWNGATIFTRQSKGGTPYLVAGRSLPTISKEQDKAA
jgi:putative phage-type endonuclease